MGVFVLNGVAHDTGGQKLEAGILQAITSISFFARNAMLLLNDCERLREQVSSGWQTGSLQRWAVEMCSFFQV